MFLDESHVHDRPAGRHVQRRPRAQEEAGRLRLPPAVGARQPAAQVRRVRGARCVRSCSSRPRRPTTRRSTPGRWSSNWCVRPGWSIRRSRCARRARQVDDLLQEISERVKANERVLVTTLTKRMAEHLTDYLADHGVKVRYLHSDIDTVERVEIMRDLRLGTFDVLVGINLLREGLDIPEVSLVAILDADKEGFLRSERSLIQTIGRAARNVNGKAILYGDKITDSMRRAIDETERRRNKQIALQPREAASRRAGWSSAFATLSTAPFQLFQPVSAGGRPADGDRRRSSKASSDGLAFQTLLGVTGSGKTFTMANVIAQLGRPAIVFAPNKTLAAQLYARVPRVLPAERGRVLRQLLRLLPARSLRAAARPLHREGLVDQRAHRADAAVGDQERCWSGATWSSSPRCRAIYGIGDPPRTTPRCGMIAAHAATSSASATSIAPPDRACSTSATRPTSQRGTFRVRGDTIDVFPAEHSETGGAHRAVRRRDRVAARCSIR